MKIIFYKAKEGTIVDKAIAFWTGGEYSHCEIVIHWDDGSDVCLSASSRDGGVRMKKIKDYKTSGKWDIYDINLDINKIKYFWDETRGKKYDWIGIIFHEFLPFRLHNNDNWYCSEWIAKLLCLNGYSKLDNEIQISPSKLHNRLIEYEYIKINLVPEIGSKGLYINL